MDTQAVLDHHLEAFGAGDVDATMEDYTEESVFISPRGTAVGLDAIRGVFEGLYSGPFKPGTFEFTMDKTEVVGETAYVLWHADLQTATVPIASDTFIIRDGKIAVQTVALKMDPK